MESLYRVVEDSETIVTRDACRARRQALPDFMLVNPRAARRLIKAARQVGPRQGKGRGQCSTWGPAAEAGLKVHRVEARTAFSHVDRSGLPAWRPLPSETIKGSRDSLAHQPNSMHASAPTIAEDAHLRGAPDMSPGGSREMCVNDIGAWDVKAV
jgi:hypothetical protein